MVALEAWALGTPVLANGKCDVLKGQCSAATPGCTRPTRIRGDAAVDRAESLVEQRSAKRPPVLSRRRRLAGSISTCSSA